VTDETLSEQELRNKLQGDLARRYDALQTLVDDGLKAQRKVWLSCPSCRKRSEVEVPDVRGAVQAFEAFANQAYGRPGLASSGPDSERIVFERVIYMGCDGCTCDACLKDREEAV
jgi:hypothetical protein